jgi:tripartite-type tricarboxylate transporter receptor subunit TctC
VDLHFASLPAAVPLVRAGRLRALAVASPRRSPSLPDVPTLESFGYTDFDYHVFYGVVAPAATPRTPIERLNTAINAAIETQDLRATLADLGVEAQRGSPQQFGAFLAAERTKWAAAVKASGAKVD